VPVLTRNASTQPASPQLAVAGRGVQVPTEPASAHDVHSEAQALLQHTPAAQNPLVHSALLAQASPLAFCETQLPPLQKVAPAQSLGALHVVLHAPVPSHVAYGAHPVPLAGAPAGMAVQVPREPARSHARHAPPQAALQQ
jgi:hypothetical protein